MNNASPLSRRWSTRDIVTASVVAVATGLLFAVWNVANAPILDPLGVVVPGLSAVGHGVWLLGGLLTALVIRKPGAALYGEVVAATVSALIGNQWGVITLLYGAVQGIGAELIFAILLYRSWGVVAALLAGAGSGIAMAVLDLSLYYAGQTPCSQSFMRPHRWLPASSLPVSVGMRSLERSLGQGSSHVDDGGNSWCGGRSETLRLPLPRRRETGFSSFQLGAPRGKQCSHCGPLGLR